ncbi:Uncharacterised protein [uncultured archaeon]|nr:Uncharacterised protein [uncultured archaeon]
MQPPSTVPAEKLRRIIASKTVSDADLELLGTLMLKGDLSSEAAERILQGKTTVRGGSRRQTPKKDYRIEEDEGAVRIEMQDGEKIGDFQWSTRKFSGKPVMFIHEIYVEPEYREKGY